MELVRARFFLTGNVQGVGMRWDLERIAQRFSLDGFVRNLPDSRVEGALEGPRNQVEHALKELKKARGALGRGSIETMEIKWETPVQDKKGFQILL